MTIWFHWVLIYTSNCNGKITERARLFKRLLIYRDKCFSNWFFMIDTIFVCVCVCQVHAGHTNYHGNNIFFFHFCWRPVFRLAGSFRFSLFFCFYFSFSFYLRNFRWHFIFPMYICAHNFYMDWAAVSVFVWKWNVNKLLHTFRFSFIRVTSTRYTLAFR